MPRRPSRWFVGCAAVRVQQPGRRQRCGHRDVSAGVLADVVRRPNRGSVTKPSAIAEPCRPWAAPGCRRSTGSAAPTPAGTSRWSGTAPRAATTWRRTAASERHTRSTGPAPIRAPSSKTDRNTAKFSEIRVTPNSSAPVAQLGDHELDDAVGRPSGFGASGRGTPRSRPTARATACRPRPRPCRRRGRPATASTSRQSPSAGSPSRPRAIEKPRSVSVSRQASARAIDLRHLVGRDVAVAADPDGVCRLADPVTACRTCRMSRPSRLNRGSRGSPRRRAGGRGARPRS